MGVADGSADGVTPGDEVGEGVAVGVSSASEVDVTVGVQVGGFGLSLGVAVDGGGSVGSSCRRAVNRVPDAVTSSARAGPNDTSPPATANRQMIATILLRFRGATTKSFRLRVSPPCHMRILARADLSCKSRGQGNLQSSSFFVPLPSTIRPATGQFVAVRESAGAGRPARNRVALPPDAPPGACK